ncbi:hypothetical protein DFR35_1830 [Sulfurisoma sediminicola]|uniref:Uncharacterized protein n=2 Tax=Sulfurisoma sediminicola TaxID=1381557 RepID=A0A497XEN8_9PROT|nr:hypothetical protein DFR35_1830 [Sulfurisoma sediminicola]
MRFLRHLPSCLIALCVAPAGATSNDPDTWSSAWQRHLAPRWVAERDGAAGADRLFVIVCDPQQPDSTIRSMAQLAALREDYRRSPQAWEDGDRSRYTCIAANSFRLEAPAGRAGPPPAGEDELGIREGWYRIVRQDADAQIVALRYRDLGTGIYDSSFVYEVRKDRVIPLESWVVGRGLMQLLTGAAIGVLLLLLTAAAAYGLFRRTRSRRARD